MGGPGSGRRWRWDTKNTVEGCRRIDIRDWHRRGLLWSWGFGWNWYARDREQVASIWVRVQPGLQVALVYRFQVGSGDWQDVEEPITLAWTPCHYGGRRPWFVCPGLRCGQRVAVLYTRGRYFLCRRCYDLRYESQREDRMTRQLSKAQKIRRRLGGSANMLEPFPSKPMGMHWRTYERLHWTEMCAHSASLLAMQEQLDRMHRILAGPTRGQRG